MRKGISNTAKQPTATGPLYVAYYRVSTVRQGVSGLGLEAQRAGVAGYLQGKEGILAEFTEIESGKKHTNRPQLAAPIAECQRAGATLIMPSWTVLPETCISSQD